MNYAALRPTIDTGDVLLYEGRGFVSKAIRMLTGNQFSHVAVFVWLDEDDLWLAEMKEFLGYRLRRASEAVEADFDDALLYLGKIPLKPTEDDSRAMRGVILSSTAEKYGYLSLMKIWWSQVRNKKFKTRRLVCSTFAAKVWGSVGVMFPKTPDPGDFLSMSGSVKLIKQ